MHAPVFPRVCGYRIHLVVRVISLILKLLEFLRGDVPVSSTLGTLRSEDGYGTENVAEKVNSRSFNLQRDYSKSLTLSNVGEPS